MSPAQGIPGASLWTVARQTFVQCLRTKVAAVFAVLLIASLALLPSLMEGDGTMAGRIRTFLDYSTTAVSVLLALVVVLLSVGLISGDVAGKHICILCTKPLSRWQYVIGRWLGVVLLAGALQAGAYAAIYLTAQYLRGRTDLAVGPEDARAVETEVFASRTRTPAPPADVNAVVRQRIEQKKKQGNWDGAVQSYVDNYGLTWPSAIEKLVEDMRRSATAEAQSAAPGGSLVWNFTGLDSAGRQAYGGPGIVVAVDSGTGVVAVRTLPEMVHKLVIFGPVWVDGAVGRVVGLWQDGFRAAFPIEAIKSHFANAEPGRDVKVAAQPTLQLSYRLTPSGPDGARNRLAAWKFENPSNGFVYDIPPQEVRVGQQATVILPAAAVDKSGRMRARYFNYSAGSATMLSGEMSVLYGVGGFEVNFIKSGLLVLMGLMFLAALGTCAGAAMSFAVGSLLCFVLLWIGTALRFLTEAISYGAGPGEKGLIPAMYEVADWMLAVMKIILPDLASTLSTDFLVEGTQITWDYFGETALLTVGLRAAVLLGLGCLLFHRRELAQVQV